MGEINLASLNVNGARDFKKRAQVFEIMKHKKIDVLFVQETHSECSISPVCLSDHSLIKCVVAKRFVKSKSAFWHFNNNLLSYCSKYYN